MPIKIRKTSGAIRIDQGVYTTVIEKVEVGMHEKNGEYLRWSFRIKDPITQDGKEVTLTEPFTGITGTKWTKSMKNKLNKLLIACGVDVESFSEGDDIDLEQLVGSSVRIIVVDAEKDGAILSKVDNFMPVLKAGSKTAPPASAKAEAPKKVTVTVAPKAQPVEEEDGSEDQAPPSTPKVEVTTKEDIFDFDS